jgi:Uncharacterised nucleotidyltransferase
MNGPLPCSAPGDDLDAGAMKFYRHLLEILSDAGLPFLVGGAFALNRYIGVTRPTKDVDLFIRRYDLERVSAALLGAGYRTEMTYPHWLAKVRSNGDFADLIFSSGNGVADVDDAWFEHAIESDVLGVKVKLCPAEEMIWSKAFIMERERFDGADIAHLLRAYGDRLDWRRLLARFNSHWRVLLSHVVLFGFAYPGHRDLVPAPVTLELLERLRAEIEEPRPDRNVCAGTLLSREQYLTDIEQWGYRDARLAPTGNMTPKDTAHWTEAIQHKDEH